MSAPVIPLGYSNHWTARFWPAMMLAVVLASCVLAAKGAALAAPPEEDLPGAPLPQVHHPIRSVAANDSDGSAESPQPGDSAETGASGPSSGDDAGQAAPVAPAPPPHFSNYFPYTIRPGDTLDSIATSFGLDVEELKRVNHVSEETGLIAGHTLRIPNPFLGRQRQLEGEIDRLSAERQDTAQHAGLADQQLSAAQATVNDLTVANHELRHESASLPWWRAATYLAAAAAILMFGTMAVALVEWLKLRGRFRAVAEMNESLRRLDYRYRNTVAKAELRLQELYGRRRRGIEDGQERPRLAEDAELEHLNQQLKEILEKHLGRLGPPGERARRARWRELIGGIGAPAEARSARR
ncbi:MAG: LysM peptidoglycan-binding domain-containing protein [Candidatus Binataceae bacterium]